MSRPTEGPRDSSPSLNRTTSDGITTNGASSRLSNVATGGDTESPPPLPTTSDYAIYPGPYTGRQFQEAPSQSLPINSFTGLETGPLSHSAGSLPLHRSLHQISSEMLSGTGTSTSGRPSTAGSHVPSLTSRAFLAPMSSQKLQMHRNQRPTSLQPPPADVEFDRSSTPNRNSTGSAFTFSGGHALPTQYDTDTLPSESRATSRASERSEFPEDSAVDRDRDFREFLATEQAQRQLQSATQPVGDAQAKQATKSQDQQYIPDQQNRHQRSRSFLSNLRPDSLHSLHSSFVGRSNGHLPLASADVSPRPASPIERQKEIVKPHLGRNYEYFTGNTVFFWGGRLQNARDKPVVLITAIIIILPAILFFIFSAPWLWHHVSPAIPIIFAYLFFVCISSFIHASVTNPGILPRNLHPLPPPDPSEDPLTVGPPTTDWIMVKSATAQHGAFEVPTKYCKSCNIWRPPRCHHCRVCDNCVETQDHHCLWLNNCVGRRNYRYFFTFVSSGTLLGIYLFGASAGHVWAWRNQNGGSSAHAINENRVPFAMFIYGLLAFMYPASLWGYHTFLIGRGQTTREYLNSNKFAKQDRHRPFNQKQWWKNFVVVLARPRPPTFLNFKDKYIEGDQRYGPRRGHRTTPLSAKQQGGMEMQHMGNGNANGRSFQGGHALRNALNGGRREA